MQKIKKIINLFVLMFFIAFSLLFCLNKVNKSHIISNNNSTPEIYELWHIESFEGGGLSRLTYLKNIALEYEKQNPNKLFIVKQIESDQLANALSKNFPHIISFSEQVAKDILPLLKNFDKEYNIQDNFLKSAQYNGKLMALPFIASGYCYFTKTSSKENLTTYTANNNLHTAIDITNNTNINNNQILSSYECYTKFVNSNNIKLLGTARDLFRIKNLESLGRFSVNYEPVSSFSDLVQYLGTTSNNPEVIKFIDFALSDVNQKNLTKFSLFSTKQLSLYTEPIYLQMENAINQCNIPNIFNN